MISENKEVKDDLSIELVLKNENEYVVKRKQNAVSFDKGFFLSVRAIHMLREKIPRTMFVGIAGPSGAGKTSMAKKIASLIPKTLIISLDNYLDASRKVIDENFDDFRLVDFDLLLQNIKELREGKTTQMPLYDFRKSGRYAYKPIQPPESRVVIVEGIYALHEKLRPVMDLKISVSGGVHYDLIKRIVRDTQRTGQEPKDSIRQITETVYPMYKAFIEPDLQHAEIRIFNSFNPFSGLLNPTYSLKSAKNVPIDLLRSVLFGEGSLDETLQNAASIFKELKFKHRKEKYYDIYLNPPSDVETEHQDSSLQSIRVRNFNGQYFVLFSETIRDSYFIISPQIEFMIDVRTFGGLMSLGYKIAAIINRSSEIYESDKITISFDEIQQLGKTFVQIKGEDRDLVYKTGALLGLEGTYIALSYIEMYMQKMSHFPQSTISNNNQIAALTKSSTTAKSNDGSVISKL